MEPEDPPRPPSDGGAVVLDLPPPEELRGRWAAADHEYSETFYGEGAAYFEVPETDLLAAGESWWADALAWHDEQDGQWVCFLYAFDGQTWRRAPYDAEDGYRALALPALSDEACSAMALEFAHEGEPGQRGAAS